MKWSQPLRVFTIIRKRTGSSVSLPARWEGKLVRFYHPFRNISMLFLSYSYPNQCNAKVVLRSLTKKMAPKMNHLCVENYPVGCWFNRASTTSITILSFRFDMSVADQSFTNDFTRHETFLHHFITRITSSFSQSIFHRERMLGYSIPWESLQSSRWLFL